MVRRWGKESRQVALSWRQGDRVHVVVELRTARTHRAQWWINSCVSGNHGAWPDTCMVIQCVYRSLSITTKNTVQQCRDYCRGRERTNGMEWAQVTRLHHQTPHPPETINIYLPLTPLTNREQKALGKNNRIQVTIFGVMEGMQIECTWKAGKKMCLFFPWPYFSTPWFNLWHQL